MVEVVGALEISLAILATGTTKALWPTQAAE